MTTDKKEQEQKIVTKKHMARLEKEKRQKKILLTGIISIVAVVILLITYGILSKTVLLQNRAVAQVNDQKITVSDFQKRVEYQRFTLQQTYVNYYTSGLADYLQSYLIQIQNQLDSSLSLGQSVLDAMVTEAVIIQKAEELGLSVSDEEISEELENSFGFYENGTPTAVPTIAYKPTSTYSPTQLALLAPVASPTATATEEVPVAQDNEVMSTESPIDDSLIEDSTATPTATEVLPTNTPTEEPSATPVPPTATPFTREGYENLYATSVANLTSNTRYNETDFREYVRSLLFQQKMYDYVVKDLTPDQEMVWVRHMLVTTEEEALTILDKLDNGEDFASLAAEFSTDTANSFNGGDLGWTYQGQMVSEFEKAAWSLKIGEISEPVQTQYGFHIIQVLGREIRPMDENTFSGYKNTIFQNYVDELKSNAEIETFDLWASVVPSSPSIPSELRIAQ